MLRSDAARMGRKARKRTLPKKKRYAILGHGEMSEWSNVPLSKSGRVNSPRGFESHSLRFWRSLIVV